VRHLLQLIGFHYLALEAIGEPDETAVSMTTGGVNGHDLACTACGGKWTPTPLFWSTMKA
jgi:hypothetical protein